MSDRDAIASGMQISRLMSEALMKHLLAFVVPLLAALDAQIDKRLVRNFASALQALVEFQNRAYGLLLSELDGYVLTTEQAPAGTKWNRKAEPEHSDSALPLAFCSEPPVARLSSVILGSQRNCGMTHVSRCKLRARPSPNRRTLQV